MAHILQDLSPWLADKIAEKLAQPFRQSQISMDLHPWYVWYENSVTYIFKSIPKIGAQNLTVETQNSCILETTCGQNMKLIEYIKNVANFFYKVRYRFGMIYICFILYIALFSSQLVWYQILPSVSVITSERTKFLLAVIYGSARRHSIGSKTFKKNREKKIHH